MSNRPKSGSPTLAIKLAAAAIFVGALFAAGAFIVWYFMFRQSAATTPVALITPEPGGKVIVPLANYAFVPNDLLIPAGTTVIFQNVDPDPHTVTFDNDEYPSLGFGPGDQFEMTFDEVGVFQIYCEYHGSPGLRGMSATIRVAPAEEQAAIPTSVAAPTGTPRPTLEPLPTQSFASNGVGLFQDSQTANDTFNLVVSSLPANPPGDYHAWLTGEGAALDLGVITPDAAGDIHLLYLAPTGENLLASYSGFIISVEAAGASPAQPSSSVIFGGVISPGILGPARQLLAAGDDAPDQKGYATGLVQQAEEMLRHAREIDNAAQAGDTASMNRHIEHLTAILAGKGSPEYIDFEGDGFITDPGDGFGILNYAEAIAAQADSILAEPDVSAADHLRAAQLVEVANAIKTIGNRLIELRLAAHEAQTSADQKAHTAEIFALSEHLLNGVDANSNGTVEAIAGEGGAYTVYFQSQYISAMGVLTQDALAALPTAGPPTPTAEPGQPTATPAPTNTPESPPTPGPVIVVFRNFEIVPAELTIKAGTTVIFQIQDSQHEVYESFPGSIDIAGTFDSGPLSPGDTYTLTFNNPRTLTIRCGFHPNKMVMTLKVVP